MQTISIHQYLMDYTHIPLFDVRSPIEYNRGHIPFAISLPLFSNEERAEIGTIYKEKGQEKAIDRGLALAGAKMQQYVNDLKGLTTSKQIALHCWRGGRRSGSLAWLFSFVGYDVFIIEKGYKAYRNYVLKMIDKVDLKLLVLGGKTGSAKTAILGELAKRGEQMVDLESLANHKGSAFGAIDEEAQPSSEYFENLLFHELKQLDHSKRIWVENESRGIGQVFIPDVFWKKMKDAPLIQLEIPQEERAQYLAETYGTFKTEDLKQSFESIRKRIGGLALTQALQAIDDQDYKSAAIIALQYYDKTYKYGFETNTSPNIDILHFSKIKLKHITNTILNHVNA